MELLLVLFMAFMVFAMFAIDYQFCRIRETLNDMKFLMELNKKYESENDNG
jgi:hypothetical protein